jgi:hypothetical protein
MLIVSFGVGRLTFQIIIKNGMRTPMPPSDLALEDPLPSATTGRFPAVQLNAGKKPFVADNHRHEVAG